MYIHLQAGDVDLSAVGRTTLSFWSAMLKRADADLSSSSPNVAANKTNNSGEGHVKYENLIKDPVGTIRELYRTFGWDFSKVLTCVREYEDAHRSFALYLSSSFFFFLTQHHSFVGLFVGLFGFLTSGIRRAARGLCGEE